MLLYNFPGNFQTRCHSPLPNWNVDVDELVTVEVMAAQRNIQKRTLDFKLLRK